MDGFEGGTILELVSLVLSVGMNERTLDGGNLRRDTHPNETVAERSLVTALGEFFERTSYLPTRKHS